LNQSKKKQFQTNKRAKEKNKFFFFHPFTLFSLFHFHLLSINKEKDKNEEFSPPKSKNFGKK